MKTNAVRTLAICLVIALGVLGGEAYWLFNWSMEIAASVRTSMARTAAANQRRVVCDALERNKDVLGTVHTRYADSTVPAPTSPAPPVIPGATPTVRLPEPPAPTQMSLLRDANLALGSEVNPGGRAWTARGPIEWHRLLPTLAAFESAYPLAIVEEVALINSAPPFAMQAVALDARMRVRFPIRPAGAGAPVKK